MQTLRHALHLHDSAFVFAAFFALLTLLCALVALAIHLNRPGHGGLARSAFQAVIAPFREEWRTVALFAVVLAGGAWVFFDIVEDLNSEPSLAHSDAAVFYTLQSFRNPTADHILIAITELGDALVVMALAAAVAVWLAVRKAWRTLVYWLIAVAGGSIITTAIKVALHRARPIELYSAGWNAFSFPSGHSTTNVVLYGFLVVLTVRRFDVPVRVLVAGAAACLVGLIGFSRLYLGAHWLSDVVGGLAVGSAWSAILAISLYRHPQEDIAPGRLLLVAAATLCLAGGGNIALNHKADWQRYTVAAQKTEVTFKLGYMPK